MAASLVYSPLAADCIRLFRLRHDTSDVRSGSLVAVRLDDAPPYFTLSYSWGTQKQDVPIKIDG
jgi:hypothetical protein